MRTIIRDNYTPEPGDYHDMYVFDEAQGKSWRFDCDGVFYETTIQNEYGDSTTTAASQYLVTHVADGIDEKIAEEAAIREAADDTLQEEIDELKNSPDVVDIVATYADLQAYDTSKLGDKDVIRVLTDETHDNESSYYRWDKTNNQWVFIGAVEGYYTKAQTDDLLDEKQDTLTAGANISIDSNNVISATDTTYTAGTNVSISSDNVISATDTTYSDFVGTDGTVAGSAGLVPAPATTDAGKFLKADGTWDEAGSPINVVQTTGTSTTDVMSQNAVTSMVFADPDIKQQVRIGDGSAVQGTYGIAIGRNSYAQASNGICIGQAASVYVNNSYGGIAIGQGSQVGSAGGNTISDAIALGRGAAASRQGEINIADNRWPSAAFNNTKYRLISGLYDGQSDHDAATFGQVISYSAINGAGAPTTATEGKYVGQLYYDTTNEQMYYLKEIDTTTTPATYTWETLGGGSSINVVQTTGTSTTDVMSQNAVTSMVFADPANRQIVQIGYGSSAATAGTIAIGAQTNSQAIDSISIGNSAKTTNSTFAIAIGGSATVTNGYGIAIGQGASAGTQGVAIGRGAKAFANSVALGQSEAGAQGAVTLPFGKTTTQGDFYIGTLGIHSAYESLGYNNTSYRLISGVYDGQGLHDAATLAQGNTLSSTAPTSSTEGVLGQLFTDTTNGVLYHCTAIDTTDPNNPVYTWDTVGGGTGPTVVQTTGTSTTDVMSQNATTSMVFADPATKNQIKIGDGTSSSTGHTVVLGDYASANYQGCVALGATAGGYGTFTSRGIVAINSTNPSLGYGGNSNYRLITGVYDPQNDHDAATKGYVDTAVASAGANTISSQDWSALWQ